MECVVDETNEFQNSSYVDDGWKVVCRNGNAACIVTYFPTMLYNSIHMFVCCATHLSTALTKDQFVKLSPLGCVAC